MKIVASTKGLDGEVRPLQNVIFRSLSHDVYEQRAESGDLLQHRAGMQDPPSKWSLVCPLLIFHQWSPIQSLYVEFRAGCVERGRLMTIFQLVQV